MPHTFPLTRTHHTTTSTSACTCISASTSTHTHTHTHTHVAKPVAQQEDILKSMTILDVGPAGVIFDEGDTSDDLYIVVASEHTCSTAHVEVVRNGRVLTHLYRGQYFGQMQFLTKQPRARNAAIRVPANLGCNVKIARISAQHFERWSFFRTMLIVRAVPFLSTLKRGDRYVCVCVCGA